MIIRLYEGHIAEDILWVGDLEDLIQENPDLPGVRIAALRDLEPGEWMSLGNKFRAQRPEKVSVPFIPPTPQAQLDFEAAQEAAWEEHVEKLDMNEVQERGDLFLRRSNFIDGFAHGWGARGKA